MDNSKIDLGKKDKRAESRNDVKAELNEEELSNVSGGKGSTLALACASGKHLTTGKITI